MGGRWNAIGMPALYLSLDHATAIAEHHRDLVQPGTLVAFDVTANAIADLGAGEVSRETLTTPWRAEVRASRTPATWTLAATLAASGVEGILCPSAIHAGGTNLVLWQWHDASVAEAPGAALRLLDPHGDLKSANAT